MYESNLRNGDIDKQIRQMTLVHRSGFVVKLFKVLKLKVPFFDILPFWNFFIQLVFNVSV